VSAPPRRLRLASDEIEVVLLPDLGARLHRLRVFGHDLLRTPPGLELYRVEPFFWGSFVMAPWCNRIEARPTRVGERTADPAQNFDDGAAIHGQVFAIPWDVDADGTLRVEAGGDAWPWRYRVDLRVSVEGYRLRLDLALSNRSAEPMPAGLGLHPWFLQPLEVAIPAAAVFRSNEDSRPTSEAVAGSTDLRALGPMPPGLDATWVRSDDRPIELRWPTLRTAALMYAASEAGYVCAASPAGLGAVAIEPQTHAPNGMRRLLRHETGALRWLAPGEALPLHVELVFSEGAGGSIGAGRCGRGVAPVSCDLVHEERSEPEGPVGGRRLLAIAYGSFLLIGWAGLLVPALIRSIEHDFAQTDAGLGLFYFVNAVFYAAGSFGGGFATERVGRRVVLGAAPVLLAAGLVTAGEAPDWGWFLLAALPIGLGAGIVDGGMNALVLDLAGRRPGQALNRLHLFFSIGASGSPFVIGQLVGAGIDWRTLLVATAAPAVAVGALLAGSRMPSGRHHPSPPAGAAHIAPDEAPGRRSRRALLALAIAIGFYVAAEIGVSSWVVRFLASASTGVATATLAAFWAGLALGRLAASRVADRYPPVAFTAGCALVAAAALVAAVGVPWVPVSIVGFALTGFAFGPVYPMIMSMGGALQPRRVAAVTGGLAGAAVVGGIVYPPLMGVISEGAGIGIAMLGAAALAAGSAAALWVAGPGLRPRGSETRT
jgi:galactose mutarotase-like enzyme/fucose permease